jgi:hypothetical protein
MDEVLDHPRDLGGSRAAELLVLVPMRLPEVALDRAMRRDQARESRGLVLGPRLGQLIVSSRVRDGQSMGRGLRGRIISSRDEPSNISRSICLRVDFLFHV